MRLGFAVGIVAAGCSVRAPSVAPRPRPAQAPAAIATQGEEQGEELQTSGFDSDAEDLGPLRLERACAAPIFTPRALARYRGERADVDPSGCSVHAASARLDFVRVEPSSGAPFAVELEKSEVTIHLGIEPDLPVPVDVQRPLKFSGLVNPIAYSFRGALDLEGMVHTGKGSRFVHVRAVSASRIAGVVSLGGYTETQEVEVACNAIDVPDKEETVEPVIADNALVLTPDYDGPTGGASVTLHATAGGPPKLALLGDRLFFSRVLVTSSGWTLASMRFSDGSTVRGWTRPGELMEAGYGSGFGGGDCGSGIGLGPIGFIGSCLYRGPATILRGAKLAASPHGDAWAEVTVDSPVDVIEREDGSFELRSIPGIVNMTPALAAFVDASGMRIPAHEVPAHCKKK